jgi:hypothetical protein
MVLAHSEAADIPLTGFADGPGRSGPDRCCEILWLLKNSTTGGSFDWNDFQREHIALSFSISDRHRN